MYTYPTGVILGRRYAGLTGQIGYRLDGSPAAAFTTIGVVETGVPGTYERTGGVPVPNGFTGRIVWGTASTDMAEEWIGPHNCEYIDRTVSSRAAPSDLLVNAEMKLLTDSQGRVTLTIDAREALSAAVLDAIEAMKHALVAAIPTVHVDVVKERAIFGPQSRPITPMPRPMR